MQLTTPTDLYIRARTKHIGRRSRIIREWSNFCFQNFVWHYYYSLVFSLSLVFSSAYFLEAIFDHQNDTTKKWDSIISAISILSHDLITSTANSSCFPDSTSVFSFSFSPLGYLNKNNLPLFFPSGSILNLKYKSFSCVDVFTRSQCCLDDHGSCFSIHTRGGSNISRQEQGSWISEQAAASCHSENFELTYNVIHINPKSKCFLVLSITN